LTALIIIGLDAVVVAPIFERSYAMFRSFIGTWLPFAGIFAASLLAGFLISTWPAWQRFNDVRILPVRPSQGQLWVMERTRYRGKAAMPLAASREGSNGVTASIEG